MIRQEYSLSQFPPTADTESSFQRQAHCKATHTHTHTHLAAAEIPDLRESDKEDSLGLGLGGRGTSRTLDEITIFGGGGTCI